MGIIAVSSEFDTMLENPRTIFGSEALQICFELQQAGHDAVLVGGPVRDALMGHRPNDVDIATSATPDEVRALFRRTFAQGKGERHGTIGVVGASGTTYEVTTFRLDVETDGRHATVQFTKSLEEDLARRDFTINAVALRPRAGGMAELVDPFGGRTDLERRCLRAVGEASERFREDYLRILRAYRFAARFGFRLEEKTRAAMAAAVPGLARISAERIRDELMKLGKQGRGADAVLSALLTMQEDGVFAVVLPELEATVGVTQDRKHHAFDVWRHSAGVAAAAVGQSRDPRFFMAALLHDTGKPATRSVDDEGNITFRRHEMVSAELADAVLRRLRFSNVDREWIVEAVAQHMRLMYVERALMTEDDAVGRRALRRVMQSLSHITVEDLLTLRVADKAAAGFPEKAVSPEFVKRVHELLRQIRDEASAVRITDLAVSGKEVMQALGVPPGPVVGATLRRLLEDVIEERVPNTREALLKRLAGIASTEGEAKAMSIRPTQKGRRGR